MKKKLCAWMLAVCVASTSIPMTALAEEAGVPVGTEAGKETVAETESEEQSGEKIQSQSEEQSDVKTEQDTEDKDTEEKDGKATGEAEENVQSDTETDTENPSELEEQADDEETEPEAADVLEERTGSLEQEKIIEVPGSMLQEEIVPGQDGDTKIAAYGSASYSSDWDKYSSNYLYNRLNSAEKAFWDALDGICNRYLTQSIDADIIDDETAAPKWAVSYAYVGRARAVEILLMFNYSNPQYYFVNEYILSNSQEQVIVPGFYPQFASASERNKATSAVKAQVNAWEAEIARESSDVMKAKKAHDLIITRVMYDQNYKYMDSNPELMDNPYHQSAYSVFCDDHTVCAGYSKAFEMLMNGAGVDTMAVTSLDHAWNIININDSWYYVDCTWDDTDGAEINGKSYEVVYQFFNRSRSKLLSLSGGQGESHVEESFYTNLLPACTLDSGATLTSIGTCWNPTTRTVAPTITLKAVSGGVRVTLSSTTSGAEIYYTLNGTDPSSSFTRSYLYTGPFTVSSSTAVKARAVSNTRLDSTVSTKTTNGKSCKVVFKANGGSSVSSQYVLYNAKATKPKNPTKSGYTFGGWYTDSKCTKAYSFSTKLTGNKTLYAKWLKKYTVKFDANSGSVKTKSKKVTYSAKYGTLPSPKKKGYSFSGWYTKKSGGTKITANSKVKIKKTTTLYAHWKKITVKTTSVSKLQNLKGRSLKVTVKKVSGATGYQIRYSTKSNMKSSSTATVKNSTTKTISKLKKGKKYYVQVRAYKTDSAGKKVYGKWSQTKKITIRK